MEDNIQVDWKIELNTQLKVFTRYIIDINYHMEMMETFGKFGTAWNDEMGAIADSLAKASAVAQGIFDQLTFKDSDNARST